jgi:hypothetical protein
MQRRSLELWYAFAAIALIGLGYALVVRHLGAVPAAGNLVGHSLGVVGFLLMLMTETLYSLRKRSRRARWGRTSSWLRFHIFTGLVGPFLVLLHASWKYNGLAGMVALMTGIVVLSGFIGRFIYTAVPRTVDGAAVEAGELEAQIAVAEAELHLWLADHPDAAHSLSRQLDAVPALSTSGPMLVLGRSFLEWIPRLAWWREKQRMEPATRAQAREIDRLLRRQRTLRRQMASLALARHMLAVWRTVHIPIGMVLFTAAFIHIGAALYYATLLR